MLPPPPAILLFHISSGPMLRVLKFVPKIIFLISRIRFAPSSSRGNCPCRRRVFQSFCHWIRLIGLSSWLNVSPHSFTNRHSSCRWANRGTSSWFCFSFWSACKSKFIRFQRKCFRLRLRGLLLVVVVLFVYQVSDQLIQSMRNSDARVRIVFVYRINSNFHSIFTLQITGCDFQHGSNFRDIPWIQPVGSVDFSSRGKVYSRHVSGCVNCENSSVCIVTKYCPTSTVFRNPASVQIFINRSCCGSFSTRSLYFCNKLSCAGISIEGLGVIINKSAGAKSGSDCPTKTGLPVFVRLWPTSENCLRL